jgi:hypothetical protein
MKTVNSKLIDLVNSFSQKEIKEFKKLISSSLYTGGRNYVPVLNQVNITLRIKMVHHLKRSIPKFIPEKNSTARL